MRTFLSFYMLCRPVIALFAASSAVTARLIIDPAFGRTTALLAVGVFLIACGASALNQYQERDIDGRMERTRRRPLPSGTISPSRALGIVVALIASGLVLLLPLGSAAVALAALSLLWYNGFYTPLKRRTAFASVCGAPVGMLPPTIGWAAAGGALSDPRILAIAAFFFLWQVPHFWLLLIRSGDDYERAGLPSIVRVIPRDRLAAITSVWLTAAAAASLAFPLFGMLKHGGLLFWLFPAAILMTGAAALAASRQKLAGAAFLSVNAYLLVLLLLLSTDAMTRGGR